MASLLFQKVSRNEMNDVHFLDIDYLVSAKSQQY